MVDRAYCFARDDDWVVVVYFFEVDFIFALLLTLRVLDYVAALAVY